MALTKMQDRIMLCLPAPDRSRSLSESLSELKELKDQDEYLIGNVTVRNLLNGTVEMLCQLQAGSGPRLQGLGDKWSQRLHLALPLYCTTQAEDGAVQRGLDAYKLRMEACRQKEGSGKIDVRRPDGSSHFRLPCYRRPQGAAHKDDRDATQRDSHNYPQARAR